MNFVAFDVETTGTIARVDKIVEIGAVKFTDGKPVEKFSQLVDPGRPIPREATRVHGITDEMVAGAPGIGEVLRLFQKFCGELYLVAHNAPFDIKFINAAAVANNAGTPSGQIFDTYKIAKHIMTDLMDLRLNALVKHFKISSTSFHRAEADALYCGQVFINLIQQMKKQYGANSTTRSRLTNLSGGTLNFTKVEAQPLQLGLFSGY